MNCYLMYIADGANFRGVLEPVMISAVREVYNVRSGDMIGSCFEWEFDCEGDSTIGRIQPDFETITLSGSGPAGIKMAFEIQNLCDTPFRITDGNYSFDFLISKFSTFDELKIKTFNSR